MRSDFNAACQSSAEAKASASAQAQSTPIPRLCLDGQWYRIEFIDDQKIRLTMDEAVNAEIDCSLSMAKSFFLKLYQRDSLNRCYKDEISTRLNQLGTAQSKALKEKLFSAPSPLNQQSPDQTLSQTTNPPIAPTAIEPPVTKSILKTRPSAEASNAEQASEANWKDQIEQMLASINALKESRCHLLKEEVEKLIQERPDAVPEYFTEANLGIGLRTNLSTYLKMREKTLRSMLEAAEKNQAKFDLCADKITELVTQSNAEDWAYQPPKEHSDQYWEKTTKKTRLSRPSEQSGFFEKVNFYRVHMTQLMSDKANDNILSSRHPFNQSSKHNEVQLYIMLSVYKNELANHPTCWPKPHKTEPHKTESSADNWPYDLDAVHTAAPPEASAQARAIETVTASDDIDGVAAEIAATDMTEAAARPNSRPTTNRLRWCEHNTEKIDAGDSHFFTQFHTDYYTPLVTTELSRSVNDEPPTNKKSLSVDELNQMFWGLLEPASPPATEPPNIPKSLEGAGRRQTNESP